MLSLSLSPLFLVAGCGDGAGSAGWAGTVDTLAGGVVRVSNPETGSWNEGGGWRLSEELRIGSAVEEGPSMFGNVVAIEADDRGRLYVADAHAHEIRVFDPAGVHLFTFGRRGGGPGEFEQISGMGWGPDGNLWVMDPRNSRFAVFDRSGDPIAEHRRPGGFVVMPWPGGFDERGRIYDVGLVQDEEGGFRFGLVRYAYLGESGIEPRDTFRVPRYEPAAMFTIRDSEGQTRISAAIPFTPGQRWRLGDGHLWVGTTESYRLHRVTFEGDTVRIVDRAFTPAAVSAAEKDSAVAAMDWFTDQGGRVDRSRIPDRKPAFRDLIEDDAGYLWVWPHVAAGEPDRLDVFDPEGRYLGQVPTGVSIPLAPPPIVRGDLFYAVVRDELDIQYVTRFRVQGRERSLARE